MSQPFPRLLSAVTIMVFSTGNIAWATGSPQWAITGLGRDSCGKYLAARGTQSLGMEIKFTRPDGVEFFDKSEAYFEWIDGAITGFNLSDPTGKQQVVVDLEAIEVWLRRYCNDNPTTMLSDAVEQFVISERHRHD